MRSPISRRRIRQLVATCRAESVRLLERNLTPDGIVAATPIARAQARGYGAIFGRDAAVCALGMAVSGDAGLELAAANGLATLAAYQAPNGQIPKFVDTHHAEADFWYLGCIDATLWWLAGVALLDRLPASMAPEGTVAPAGRARDSLARLPGASALLSAAAERGQRLGRHHAALGLRPLFERAVAFVKRLYALPKADETRRSAHQLFHPFSAALAEYRRARLLAHYVRRRATQSRPVSQLRQLRRLRAMRATSSATCSRASADSPTRRPAQPRPAGARAGAGECSPTPSARSATRSTPESPFGGAYMSRHRQNLAWQYHNGGVWPFVGGFWVAALARAGRTDGSAAGSRPARAGERARRLAVQRVAARPNVRAGRDARSVVERGGVPHRLRRAGAKPAVPARAQSTISRFSTDLTPSTDRATRPASSICRLSATAPLRTTLPWKVSTSISRLRTSFSA